jgi:hypothetical protein
MTLFGLEPGRIEDLFPLRCWLFSEKTFLRRLNLPAAGIL